MRIAMLLDNPFTNDGRVEREAGSLASVYSEFRLFAVKSVHAASDEVKNGVSVRRIFDPALHDIRNRWNLAIYIPEIMAFQPDVIHCHDQLMLHLGYLIKKQYPRIHLVYDSHELFHSWPLNISDFSSLSILVKSWIVRKYQIYLERRNSGKIDFLITVNDSLAADLKAYFRLKRPPVVIRNIPPAAEVPEKSDILRQKFGIPQQTRILVFIGSAIYPKTLNLEQVIDEFAGIHDLALVIIAGDQGGKKDIMKYVAAKGCNNIFFHPKIKVDEIPFYLSSADAGLVPTWNKKDLSYWYALDNKLFEYLVSGIPVLATQQPEYQLIVDAWSVGVCVNPDIKNAYIDGFYAIMKSIETYRAHVRMAANDLNWENESVKLIEFYRNLSDQIRS